MIRTDGKIERQYEIKAITKELKEFALKYNVPIVVNATLSRHFNTIPALDAEDIELCIDTEIPNKILFFFVNFLRINCTGITVLEFEGETGTLCCPRLTALNDHSHIIGLTVPGDGNDPRA